ncbi:unnamed protein product, partial [Amoebophrya sp. A120]
CLFLQVVAGTVCFCFLLQQLQIDHINRFITSGARPDELRSFRY